MTSARVFLASMFFSESGISIRPLSRSNWLLQSKKDKIEERIMVGGKIEYNT